jgi:hypothetical protein
MQIVGIKEHNYFLFFFYANKKRNKSIGFYTERFIFAAKCLGITKVEIKAYI